MKLTPSNSITAAKLSESVLPREANASKRDFGHLLLVCGSSLMPGAAILATAGALRSGCGLVTVHTPQSVTVPLVANYPSAMLSNEAEECFSSLPDGLEKYDVVGVGCGLGKAARTVEAFGKLLAACSAQSIPMVIDADALNILAMHPEYRKSVPAGSVLTPHTGELQRLIGEWKDEKELAAKCAALSSELSSVVVVKGHNSAVCTPDGKLRFNTSGNAGMAKGGSGDILTGFTAGLMARGYSAEVAAMLGVWVHGTAGDKAAEYYGEEAMNSADIIDFLGEALTEIK